MAPRRLEPGFADEVLARSSGEDFRACFSCATCTAACPLSWMDLNYNPRQILRLVTLGAKDEVLSSPAIWLCSECDICYRRCPQHVHLSSLMKAIRDVAVREGHKPMISPAEASRSTCASCGLCVQACPYQAIKLTPTWVQGRREMLVPMVDGILCHECGICTAICPVSAITVPASVRAARPGEPGRDGFGDQAILAELKQLAYGSGARREDASGHETTIVAFLCEWCLYSRLDQADIARVEQQSGIQVVRLPCLGRMDPWHILTALQDGVDGVLVVGCELGNCHYRHGNFLAENKITVLKAVLQAAGQSQRVRFAHVSSAERGVLLRLVEEMKRDVGALGPNRAPAPQNRNRVSVSHKARARALTDVQS